MPARLDGRAKSSTTDWVGATPPHPAAKRSSRAHVAAVETLRLDDGRALCARWWPGVSDGTLVLLHGMLDSSECWAPLSEGFTCRRIAFDLPGFGYSDSQPSGSIFGYARDVAQGLDMLGVTGFTLVGHSFGGAVATALAELMPRRVRGLVLLAPVGFGRIPLAEAASIWGVNDLAAVALRVALSNRYAVTAAYAAMVSNGRFPERELVDRLTGRGGRLVEGAREATRALVRASRSADAFHRRRAQYEGPVYAIWGDRDLLVPVSHREGVRAAFPQAQIAVWKGMGHLPPRERMEDLISVITRATGPSAGRIGSGRRRMTSGPAARRPGPR